MRASRPRPRSRGSAGSTTDRYISSRKEFRSGEGREEALSARATSRRAAAARATAPTSGRAGSARAALPSRRLGRFGPLGRLFGGILHQLLRDRHAFVADERLLAGEQLPHLVLVLAAEGTTQGFHLLSWSAISASRLPCAMHSVRSASVIGWSSAMPAKWLAP